MAQVRLLVGTRKGAFILTSDGTRKNWSVAGRHFPGWEVFHLKGSPVDPARIYASQTSAWFGQVIQRSDDCGLTWNAMDNNFQYDGTPGTHQWYDGTPHPWEFKRVWHIEPSLTDPDTLYAGVEDAALFQSRDGAGSWHELSGLRQHGTGPDWQPDVQEEIRLTGTNQSREMPPYIRRTADNRDSTRVAVDGAWQPSSVG